MKVKLIILVLIITCLSGCKEKIYTEKPDNVEINTINTIEVYDKASFYDLIKMTNATIVSDNFVIDTSKLYKKDLTFYYKVDKKKYVYTFPIEIIDKTEPKTFGNASKTIKVGYEDNICDLISYGDNYDKKPTCTIEGEYDVNKIGTYNIKYIISDSSNNIKEHPLNLIVVEKITPAPSSSSTKLQFSDVIKNYKNDNNEIGIDVSKWQYNIDFNKVKDAGATFVMIRLGSQKSINGPSEIDPYYEQNIKNAKEAGLKVGVYFYSMASSKEESINQAKWVIEKLGKEKLDLPVVFDWESWSIWNSFGISFHDINEIADNFIKTVIDSGYEGMLYGSKFYLEHIWVNEKNHKVWLAHYTKETTYAKEYIMWQLSSVGKIPGITTDVDINILYK